MTTMTTVENVIHLDVTQPEVCICDLASCGGVQNAHVLCPEHGMNGGPVMPIHSHKRSQESLR